MTRMDNTHPQWEEFIQRLEGPEGCNFTGEEGKPETVRWTCRGGENKLLAKAILETMEGVDVDASLEWFHINGGHCDCEILFNVVGKAPEHLFDSLAEMTAAMQRNDGLLGPRPDPVRS